MFIIIVLLIAMAFHAVCIADTILVPGDYSSIQQAIDAALNGDMILVDPGTYVENIDFKGKGIVVKSCNGPELTVIDGNQDGSVVSFQSEEGSDAVIEGFTITNGSGSELAPYFKYGGGIVCYSILGICSPKIQNNIITGNKADISGGIYCGYSSPEIKCNIITKNETESAGGGIGCVAWSSAIILNNDITDNICYWNGGGIYCDHSSPEVIDNTISSNTAWQMGGGISCDLDSSPMIKRNKITDNLAKNYGGGINCYIESYSHITNNHIVDNIAENVGGGICCYYSIPIISNNIISNNTAYNSNGGGIWCNNSPANIKNNLICNNTAGGGGGIGCYKCSSMAIINNIIFNNYSGSVGGGICIDGTSLAIINNTIYSNYASDGGGISGHDGVSIRIINSILWKNKSLFEGPEIAIYGLSSYSYIITCYTNLKGGKRAIYLEPGNILEWGPGMIDSDPLFVDGANGDFHLTFNSPCRASGTNTAPGLPDYDFEGDPRIAYGTVDMGADEFYTHLYWTGDATPGGAIELKLVGLPGTTPVGLCIGTGVLDPPLKSMWGDWYLQFPIIGPVDLGKIPSPDGVLVIPCAIPGTPPPPYSIPMQALIGNELSNLSVLVIE